MTDNNPRSRIGLMIIILIVVIAGQYLSTRYMQRAFEEKMQQYHDAINQNSLLFTALLNKLEEKKIVDKSEVLQEAQKLSADIKALIERIQAEQRQDNASTPMQGP